MRRTLITAALLGLALTLPFTASARAESDRRTELGSSRDPAGDVTIRNEEGLSTAARRSIDLRRLRVIDRGRAVRFVVTVRKVRRTDNFTQVFHLNLPAQGYIFTQGTIASHSLNSPADEHGLEHDIITEGTDTPQGFVGCYHLRTRFRDGADRWWVDIPKRCLPRGTARVEVYAQTIPGPGGSTKQFSNDTLELGRLRLGGTLPPSGEDPIQ